MSSYNLLMVLSTSPSRLGLLTSSLNASSSTTKNSFTSNLRPFCTASSRSSSASPSPSSSLPKRDVATYGIPPSSKSTPRKSLPQRSEVDNSKHPLARFFHDLQSLEAPDKRKDGSSRSWTSFELRRKSFDELHQLWYIFLRERNILLTQREEARRLRIDLANFSMHSQKLRMVQKSMARTKQVLAERSRAALQAQAILQSREASAKLLGKNQVAQ